MGCTLMSTRTLSLARGLFTSAILDPNSNDLLQMTVVLGVFHPPLDQTESVCSFPEKLWRNERPLSLWRSFPQLFSRE